MKFFQSLFIAPASLGLLSPIVANANEINFNKISDYSEQSEISSNSFEPLSTRNPLLAGGEGLEGTSNNDFDVDSFSSTTTLDGKAVMAIGAVSEGSEVGESEKVTAAYVYQMNLNTSFTGDDNLYVRLKTGDGWGAKTDAGPFDDKPATYHIEAKDNGDILKVDKIWYTFPIGEKITGTVGPLIENYYMLAATPSVYKPGVLKAFKLGGHSSAFGASTSVGVGLKFDAGNGFAASLTGNSKGAESATGAFTDEDTNKVNTQIAYTSDDWHVSATYTIQSNGWNSWHYYSTDAVASAASGNDAEGLALRAWWRPEETGTAVPSISVGYDTIDFDKEVAGKAKDASGYMVGLNWQDMFQADDRIGVAIGQPLKADSDDVSTEGDPFIWEAYYSFRPNDSIEITPAVFGGSEQEKAGTEDIFGAVVTTTFKF